MVATRWGGLRIEPYDPDARDADGDGIVQEGTAWERPVGTNLVDDAGRAIDRGVTATERPKGVRVVGADGKDVAYKPSYGDTPAGTGKPTPLSNLGYPSLRERGLVSLKDSGLRSVKDIVAPDLPPPPPPPKPPNPVPYRSPLTTSTAMARSEEVQKAIAEFDALPDNQMVIVYHGTNLENANRIRETGLSGFEPRGDDVSGVTRGYGMYVAATERDAQMYAGRDGEVISVVVPKGSLRVSPEMTTEGATVGYSLYNPSAGALVPGGSPVQMADTQPPWTPRWGDVSEILDMDYIRDLVGADPDIDDESVLFDWYTRTVDAWEQWNPCRSTRKAAYELSGAEVSPADPNIGRTRGYFGNGFDAARDDEEYVEMAKYLMGSLAQDVQGGKSWENPTIYRAMDVSGADEEGFWAAMQPGQTVDIPLLSFMDRRDQGPNQFLTKFGEDVLIQVEDRPHSIEMGVMEALYDEAAERRTLDGLVDMIDDMRDQRDSGDLDEEEMEEFDQFISDVQRLLDEYEKVTDPEDRKRLQSDLGNYFTERTGEDARWHGDTIEEEDSEYYYAMEDPYSNRSLLPTERVSGGRFEVIAVEEDPKGAYGAVVRLRHIGAFDPAEPGRLVMVEK